MDPSEMDISKYLPVEALNKFYDDAVSPSAKQVGKLGEDTLKTARLILAPLQIVAAAQDRFERMVKRIADRVPEDRRVEPPAEIALPVVEHLRVCGEDSPLSAMFEEILAKSIDKDGQEKVHPAFPHMISQLSRDEAWILFRLRDTNFVVRDYLVLSHTTLNFTERLVEYSELPTDELYAENKIELLFSHLQALGLVEWPIVKQDGVWDGTRQTGLRRESTMRLTELGRLLVGAAIPDDGFERFAKTN